MTGWGKIYPDKRIVTLILDPFEAEELLAQALAEGRRIGDRTIMGMPMIAFGDSTDKSDAHDRRPAHVEPVDSVDLDNRRSLGRKVEHAPETKTEQPEGNVVILTVVRREPLPEKPADPAPPAAPAPQPVPAQRNPPLADTWSPFKAKTPQQPPNSKRRSILDEQPPRNPPPAPAEHDRRFNKARNKWERRGGISDADRALIDEAIAQGRVTKCPDCKHSVEPGQLLPGEGWRKGKKKGTPHVIS